MRIGKLVWRRGKKLVAVIIFRLLNQVFGLLFKLNPRRVVFFSDVRANLGGNLEFIHNYLDGSDYERLLILKRNRKSRRRIKDKFAMVYHLSTAKYIILDDYSVFISLIKPRPSQKICQVWHASGAFKKFGFSRTDNTQSTKWWGAHGNYTNVLVSSESVIDCYAEGFGVSPESIRATGTPRTDVFFDHDAMEASRQSFYDEHPELAGKRILLFAPTYRGPSVAQASYDFDAIDFAKLRESLHDKGYVFAFKWHPAVYDRITDEMEGLLDGSDFFYDFSGQRDINDLLLVADTLITDYSSVIFDYALLDKPVVYFAPDLSEYTNDRGLYFDMVEYVYGPVAQNTEQLVDVIGATTDHQVQRHQFLAKFMGACDGESTRKACQWIFDDDLAATGGE